MKEVVASVIGDRPEIIGATERVNAVEETGKKKRITMTKVTVAGGLGQNEELITYYNSSVPLHISNPLT